MLLCQRVFRVTRHYDEPRWDCKNLTDDCGIFEKWIRRHFELPKQVSEVVISLHSHSSVNRKKGRVKGHFYVPRWAILRFDRTEWEAADLNPILIPLIGQTVYLQVEYE